MNRHTVQTCGCVIDYDPSIGGSFDLTAVTDFFPCAEHVGPLAVSHPKIVDEQRRKNYGVGEIATRLKGLGVTEGDVEWYFDASRNVHFVLPDKAVGANKIALQAALNQRFGGGRAVID